MLGAKVLIVPTAVNPDSLYKYTSWEDPVRTLGSYIGIISVLCAAHYLPLTQTALKAGATVLGVAATVEYAHRSFTPNTILARLRPAEYKRIPEPVLNDTLKDLHDLVQFLVVEAQRIVLGQHLGRTFGAFITLATLYFLVKIVSPFGLVLLGVTALYTAPLVTSRHGREVLEAAKARTADMSNAALESSQALAQAGKDKAAELSTATQQTAADTKRRAGELVQGGANPSRATDENADALMEAAKNTVDKTSDKANRAVGQDDQQTRPSHDTTAVHSHRDAGNMNSSRSNPAGVGKLSDPLSNLSAGGIAKENTHKYAEPAPHLPTYQESRLAATGLGSARQDPIVDSGDSHYALKNTSEGLRDVAQSTPRHDASTAVSTSSAAPGLASEADQADTGILNRPRAIPPLANLDQTSPAFGKS
ncbi:unnamed protein product, partial [Clonostachys solani]